jgi:hypothetical protein
MTARLVAIKDGQWVPVTDWRRMPGLIKADLKGDYKEPSTPPNPKKAY